MSFTSASFLVFLVIVFVGYYLTPARFRWGVLLTASMVFYGFAGLSFLLYLVTTILSVYGMTMQIRRVNHARDAQIAACTDRESRRALRAKAKIASRRWFLACLLLNLGILAVIKYTDFMIGNLNVLLRLWAPDKTLGFVGFALPLGLSYYTFQSMGYLIDVYREKCQPETNVFKLALFVSFFPQIIQGPISRFGDLSQTLYAGNPFNAKQVSFGLQRVLWGFFKKWVIADRLIPAVLTLTQNPESYQGIYVLLGMFLYAITLYADFTGGIDIAIGVAETLGIKVTENFDRPFYSQNIADYWRRWHITMGTWFKDYIFYPISVSKPLLKISKSARKTLGDSVGKRVPVYLSLLTVWFLTGLWHGATWNFIAWGLSNGLVILVSQELQPLYDRFHARFPWGRSKIYTAFQVFRTFWLMCFIRSFDCYNGVGTTLKMMLSVWTRFSFSQWLSEGVQNLGLPPSAYVSAGLGVAVMLWVSYVQRSQVDIRVVLAAKPFPVKWAAVSALLFMLIIFGAYGIGYDAQQFIYNRF